MSYRTRTLLEIAPTEGDELLELEVKGFDDARTLDVEITREEVNEGGDDVSRTVVVGFELSIPEIGGLVKFLADAFPELVPGRQGPSS